MLLIKFEEQSNSVTSNRDITNPRYIEQFSFPVNLIRRRKRLDKANPRYMELVFVSLECSVYLGPIVYSSSTHSL